MLKKFVIFGHPRCGSNYLCTMLDAHPKILCHSEVFHDENIHYSPNFNVEEMRAYTLQKRDENPSEFLRKLFAYNMGAEAVGMKIFQHHSMEAHNIILNDKSILKIFLSRRNIIQAFVSLRIATETRRFAETPRDHLYPQPKIDINVEKLLKFDKDISEYFVWLKQVLRDTDQKYLELYYEDIVSNQDAINTVFLFLGIERGEYKLTSRLRKQNKDSLVDKINNMESLKVGLRGTHLEKFLDEMPENIQAELAFVKAELAFVKAELAFVKAELAFVKAELASVKAESASVKAESASVKAESASVKAQRDALLNSLSWRYTAPIRAIIDKFK